MMSENTTTYRMSGSDRIQKAAFTASLIGIAGCAVSVLIDAEQFFHSWLVSSVFWLTLALGGLFFTMLHHLANATWSIVVRRISEHIMSILPLMVIPFAVVLAGIPELYRWSDVNLAAHDVLLQKKAGYLNVPFFIVRTAGYFVIWFLLARVLYKSSLRQDSKHSDTLTKTFRRVSAPGMILFALTVTFASFDWLMSLDAHWYSTIFGAYIFSGSVVGMLSFLTLAALRLRRQNFLKDTITAEHYDILGKLLFAFMVFWAYMAFSQYFIIWYGNIPEETIWYVERWEGSWKTVSLVIVFGHFVAPFFVLITHAAKRNLKVLGFLAAWLLAMHWVDIYWVIMPSLHHHGPHFSWVDLAATVAIGGGFLGLFWRRLSMNPLVPVGDPKLETSARIIG